MINIASLNVQHARSTPYILKLIPTNDILLVQESITPSLNEIDYIREFFPHHAFIGTSKEVQNSTSNFIFIKNKFQFRYFPCYYELDNCLVGCTLEFQSFELLILNIHTPQDTQTRKKLEHTIDKLLTVHNFIIIGGDFNCALSDNDYIGHKNRPSWSWLETHIATKTLVDFYSFLNIPPQMTRYGKSPHLGGVTAARLDMFILSEKTLNILHTATIGVGYKHTDHCSLETSLCLNKPFLVIHKMAGIFLKPRKLSKRLLAQVETECDKLDLPLLPPLLM